MPALSFSAGSSPYQQQNQHQHQSSSAQPSIASQSSSSFSREMLYPLERFVVQVLILVGTVLVRGALWFFELIIKNWTSANQKLHQRKQKKQLIPDNKQMLLPTLNTSINTNNNKHNTASSSSSSFPSVSSFSENNNNIKNKNNNSKLRNDDHDDDKKKNSKNNNNTSKVDDDNAICMAHMLAAGVLPYYLASECTNAMMRPLDQELSDASSSSSSDEATAAASATSSPTENHSQNTIHPTKQQKSSSSSSSSNHHTHANQHSSYSVITKVVADGSAKFRVLFHSPPPPTTTIAAPTRRQKQHNAVDGILLVVGSSSQSDEVDSNDCNAPVLGGIAAQLAESCSAVGSLAVVSARVDFLAKPEPLSDAVDRFERLCSAVCAAFPTARGPLIILARHVTASLVLHAVVRATSTEEESSSSSSSSSSSDQDDDHNDHGTSPNTSSTCKSGTSKNPFNFLQQTPLTQSSKNNSKEDLGGLFPHVAEEEVPTRKKNRNRLNGKKRPSLKRAAIIIFSPFVGWNIIEKMKKSCDNNNKQQVLPITPDRQRSSDELFGETPDRMSSNDDGVNTTASVSHQITPQHSPQKNSFLNNNNNNKNNNNDDDEYYFDDQGEQVLLCNNDLSYDEDMFERFEEAGSYLTGMSGTSAANRNNSSNNNNNNNQDGGEGENNNNNNAQVNNQQKTSSSSPTSGGEGRIFKMLRPSFYYQKFRASSQEIASNIAHTVDFVVKNATRPDKWKLSRLFKWRIRSVCSQLWTKMQEEAPKVFSPLLIDWFPATAIRFLHPTIRAFVVCDSAAPYSVETLHWARGLVSQGCNVRLIEWSSQASKDPYSEFQARIVNNEATDWVRDLLLEVAQQQQQQHHHQNANHHRHHQNNNNSNSNKTKFPPIWENNNFSYTLADGTTNHHCQNRQNPKEEFTIVEGVRSEVQTANEDDNAYDDGKSNTNTMQHQQQNKSYFQRNNNNNNHNVSNNSSFAVASQQHYYHDQDAEKSNNNNNHQRRGSSLGGISLPSPPYGARSVTAPQPNTAPTTNRPMFPTGPSQNKNNNHQQTTALPPHQNQVRVLYQNNFLNTSSQNRAPLCKHKNHCNDDDDDDEEDNEENDKQHTSQQNNRNTTGIHASSASEDDGGEVEDEKKKQPMKKMRKKTNSGSSLSSSPISPQPQPQQQQQHSVAAAEVKSRSRGASSTSQQRQQNENTNSDGNNNNNNNAAPKIRHVDSLDRWSMHASEFGN